MKQTVMLPECAKHQLLSKVNPSLEHIQARQAKCAGSMQRGGSHSLQLYVTKQQDSTSLLPPQYNMMSPWQCQRPAEGW